MERWRSKELKEISKYSFQFFLLFIILHFSFPKDVARHTKEQAKERCTQCGKFYPAKSDDQEKMLQVHHICFEGVAKELGVPPELYHHPVNAMALCHNCHKRVHKGIIVLSYQQKTKMVENLLKAIVHYHEDELNEGERRLWKAHQWQILEMVEETANRLNLNI